MKLISIFLTLIAILGVKNETHKEDEDTDIAQRIVGGKFAKVNKFTYQVSLRFLRIHVCSGSIIGPNIVLTAGQCVIKVLDRSMLTVHAGTRDLMVGGTILDVTKVVYPTNYLSKAPGYDIAIVKTKQSFTFSDKISQIKINFKDVPEYSSVTISGWGKEGMLANKSMRLKVIKAKVLSINDCASRLYKLFTIYDANICTLSSENTGVCFYDAGGPVVYKGELIGIISWSLLCGRGYPDVHTRIASYFDWINEALKA